MSAIDDFLPLVLDDEFESSCPILTSENGIHFLYIKHKNLFLVATTYQNSNATTILLFLHQLVTVFTDYFTVLEEESIRDNFVIIYELLDEMMDFGYPQNTETKILKEYIYSCNLR